MNGSLCYAWKLFLFVVVVAVRRQFSVELKLRKRDASKDFEILQNTHFENNWTVHKVKKGRIGCSAVVTKNERDIEIHAFRYFVNRSADNRSRSVAVW